MPGNHSGQSPFVFAHRADLRSLPPEAQEYEANLHGGFSVDPRPDYGHIYFGMPGCGLMRTDPDLRHQQIIPLPDDLRPLNFHSTKIGVLDGKWRLFLPANNDAKVVVVDLDGRLDFVLPRPEFEAYRLAETSFKPTDVLLVGTRLYTADGYGANYITAADVRKQEWIGIFGGKTENPLEDGKFGTAHGISMSSDGGHLVIADRPHSRFLAHDFDGRFLGTHSVPAGAWPCGINFIEFEGRRIAAVGCLQDPIEGRPAPIYVLDGNSYEVLSTIRPKEDLGVGPAQHLHNVVWHVHEGRLFLVCQSWNPGYYFVLERV